MDESPGLLWGAPLDQHLPVPVPSRYRPLNQAERSWRGRAAIALVLIGLDTRMAWLCALTNDPASVAHLRDELLPAFPDLDLATGVIRRALTRAQEQAFHAA